MPFARAEAIHCNTAACSRAASTRINARGTRTASAKTAVNKDGSNAPSRRRGCVRANKSCNGLVAIARIAAQMSAGSKLRSIQSASTSRPPTRQIFAARRAAELSPSFLITVPFVAAGHAPCPPIALHLLRGRTRLLLVLHMTSRAQHRVYSDCTGTTDPLRKPTLDDGGGVYSCAWIRTAPIGTGPRSRLYAGWLMN